MIKNDSLIAMQPSVYLVQATVRNSDRDFGDAMTGAM